MDDQTVAALTQRLEALERRIRHWRRISGIAWIALAAALALNLLVLAPGLFSSGTPTADPDMADTDTTEEEVRARAFVLVDDDGHPRALLGLRSDGTPALAFSDRDGKIVWKAP
jgi:hypothetical protein